MLYLEARLRGGTRHWALGEGTHLLGREPQCDVVVDDLSVSRKHLRIVRSGDELELEDLKSSNGLWVDGLRVEKARIRPGQWFSTGSVLFNVRRSVTFTSLDIGASVQSTPPEKSPPGARARAHRPARLNGPEPGALPTPGPDSQAGDSPPSHAPPEPVRAGPPASGELLRTPAQAAPPLSMTDGPLPWMEGSPAAAGALDPGGLSGTYRELLREVLDREASPDGPVGALLGAVVALSGCRGGAVLLRESGETGAWILHASRGDMLPDWSLVPAGTGRKVQDPSFGPQVVRAGSLSVFVAPVRSAGLTLGAILLYPAAHAGAQPGLELLAECVAAEALARRASTGAKPQAGRLPTEGAPVDGGTEAGAAPVHGFFTMSEAGQKVLREVDRLASSELPVMLVGESGTGKELLAHRIHRRSRRAAGPFVPLNCSAFPRDLVEAELFGIHRGVATGVLARSGRFLQASGGTLFLDEVGDLPLALQPKLLRALESGEILPVGAPQPVRVDVRVVSATHLDLRQAVRDLLFRQDLLFRLAGAEVVVPPLRSRPEDILPLARRFAREAAATHGTQFLGMDLEAAACLLGYSWPGNVRELRYVVARAVVLSDGPILQEATLPEEVRRNTDRAFGDALLSLREDFRTASEAFARLYFTNLLAREGGNLSEAARKAGIGRTTLYTRLQELGLRAPRPPDTGESGGGDG